MNTLLVGVTGPAGHGKSSLVRALSGLEAGRLGDEGAPGAVGRCRALRQPDGSEIDLLETAGREDFAAAMEAAADGGGAVLIALDARTGIAPQTAEVLEIARLIGVRRGVVALTKADLAASEILAARGAIAEAVTRAGIDQPAVVATSALTGEGILQLRAALAALLGDAQPGTEDGFPYLPVDAVSALPGPCARVTGILRRGRLRVGDALAVMPGDGIATVVGLRIHGRSVENAEPGRPVAVTLSGIDGAKITRGQALCPPGLLAESTWIDVTLTAAAGATGAMPSGAACRLQFGTAAVPARLCLLDRDALEPGASAEAQIRTESGIAAPARGPFILHLDAPDGAAAAGRVLDPVACPRKPHDPRVLSDLATLARGEIPDILGLRLGQAGAAGTPLVELARLAAAPPERVRRLLATMGARAIADRFVGAAAFEALRESLLATLGRHHRDHPAEHGLAAERILRILGLGETVVKAALQDLIASGAVAEAGGLYRRAEFDPVRKEAEGVRRLEAMFRRAGLSPPDEAEAVGRDPRRREALNALIGSGTVIRAVDRVQRRAVLFHRDAILDARARLARSFPNATTPETGFLAREAGATLGISRKFSIPLLEHLDATGFTRRSGDRRTIIGKP